VEQMEGCIVWGTTVQSLVWDDSQDVMVIEDPSDAVDEYAELRMNGQVDIAHGGIPAAIRSIKE